MVDNEATALNYLERIGYYRLSGYWYSFRKLQTTKTAQGCKVQTRLDDFIEGSHFKDAVNLYIFDKKLRLLALDALERIELAIRVDIAYSLAQKDTYAHEQAYCFDGRFARKVVAGGHHKGKTEHQLWLDRYKQTLHRSRREPSVKHHINKYGKLPVWVAIEIWDFGMMSKLYAGMQYKDKMAIANKYGVSKPSTFEKWLKSLNFIRNVSAHHSRLWNINVLELSNLKDLGAKYSHLNNARPFLYFCMMQVLLKTICPSSSWKDRLKSLLNEFPTPDNQAVDAGDFGLVNGWENWPVWE